MDEETQAALKQMQEADAEPIESLEANLTPEPEEVEEPSETTETTETAESAEPKEPSPNKPPEGYVPHGALHEEREKRKALETRLAELEQRVPQPEPEQPEGMPDPILEKEKFAEWLEGRMNGPNEKLTQFEQQQQEQRQLQQRLQTAQQMEQDFMSKTPDYGDAFNYMAENRAKELEAMGYSNQPMTDQQGNQLPSQVVQIMQQEANSIFDNAMRMGSNPAEMIYNLARQRGYTPKQAAEAAGEGETLAAKAKAQENTGSLSQASGGSQAGELSLQEMSKMSDDEIADMMKDGKVPHKIAKALGA